MPGGPTFVASAPFGPIAPFAIYNFVVCADFRVTTLGVLQGAGARFASGLCLGLDVALLDFSAATAFGRAAEGHPLTKYAINRNNLGARLAALGLFRGAHARLTKRPEAHVCYSTMALLIGIAPCTAFTPFFPRGKRTIHARANRIVAALVLLASALDRCATIIGKRSDASRAIGKA